MIKQFIFTILATLFFTQAGIAQSTGTFTDSPDGQAKVDKLASIISNFN